jgi:hypothetical protein
MNMRMRGGVVPQSCFMSMLMKVTDFHGTMTPIGWNTCMCLKSRWNTPPTHEYDHSEAWICSLTKIGFKIHWNTRIVVTTQDTNNHLSILEVTLLHCLLNIMYFWKPRPLKDYSLSLNVLARQISNWLRNNESNSMWYMISATSVCSTCVCN